MASQYVVDKPLSETSLNLPLSVNGTDQQIKLGADKWPVSFLTDFIVENHHIYITSALPRIMSLMERVVTDYGLVHSELEEIFVNFHSLTIHFCAQMRKEENTLFPVIKELVKAKQNQKELAYFPFESIQSMIIDIEKDHASIEEGLASIRRLSQNFTIPENVCHSYRLLFQWLELFEKDIYLHEYLENNILFPKAIALESSMR